MTEIGNNIRGKWKLRYQRKKNKYRQFNISKPEETKTAAGKIKTRSDDSREREISTPATI